MKRLAQAPLYILLIAIYPALALASANIGQVRLDAALRPLLGSIFGGLLIYVVMRMLLRNWNSAGLVTAVAMLLFFSYGHVYELIEGASILGLNVGRHRILFPIWAMLAFVASWVIVRRKSSAAWAHRMTLPLAIAVALPIAGIAAFEVQSWGAQKQQENTLLDLETVGGMANAGGSLPDIYYIILDGYARHDVMLDAYDLDDQEFLSELEKRGFVVASCSQSNYNHTDLSLASALNFAYLDEFHEFDGADSNNRAWLPPLIRTSRVRKLLSGLGYEFIAFETGFPFTEIIDADTYLAPTSFSRNLLSGVSGFESMFIRSTAAAFFLDGIAMFSNQASSIQDSSENWHRNHVLFAFESLETIASVRGPKFVFAHIVSPHEPFVLGPSGEFVSSPPRINDEYTEQHFAAYADQAQYISKRTVEALDVLLSTAGSQPVIVVQADHGPDLGSHADNLKILNAYLFPGAFEKIYPSITPVNTFPLILNSVLGIELALKEDRSYYSSKEQPLKLEELRLECTN